MAAAAFNRGSRLIQVTNTAFVWAKNGDFVNWPLNTGPLYTGSTVVLVLISYVDVKHTPQSM